MTLPPCLPYNLLPRYGFTKLAFVFYFLKPWGYTPKVIDLSANSSFTGGPIDFACFFPDKDMRGWCGWTH